MPVKAYYSASVCEFLEDNHERILGVLASHHHHALEEQQRWAWLQQLSIPRNALSPEIFGRLFLELYIPRMGKRADAVVVLESVVLVLEFKIGAKGHLSEAFKQVEDYALDLKNFHEASHSVPIVPVLISIEAKSSRRIDIEFAEDLVASPVGSNTAELAGLILHISQSTSHPALDLNVWMAAGYKPTPTIVEAAQVLYRTHSVADISRSDAGRTNLGSLSAAVTRAIDEARQNRKKIICFVTGVPGSGKTLAGLNIATQRSDEHHDEHAVFLSGNGPLVDVLREALARDRARREGSRRRYPSSKTSLDQSYQASLATIPSVPKVARFTEAIATGNRIADRILRDRTNDGSNVPPPTYNFGVNPGDYQSTPTNFPRQPQFVQWGNVTPFVLREAAQFRPGPPPALDSLLYGRALSEVQTLGATVNSSATPEQMLIGKFWNGSIQNYWNEIAQTATVAQHMNTSDTAHVFALLNVALADSVIAFYDAKYQYNFWRPVTAIRAADPNVTPGAMPDAQWLPETTNTAPDPSYPGAHAVISAAAAEVLVATLKTDWISMDVTSEVMSGVTRHFDSISDAEAEATRSRVYAGAHFSFDLQSGERLGRRVSEFVLERAK